MDPERLPSWWEGGGWDLEPEGEPTQDREGNFPVVSGKIEKQEQMGAYLVLRNEEGPPWWLLFSLPSRRQEARPSQDGVCPGV